MSPVPGSPAGKLLTYLQGLSGNHTISGQFIETGDYTPIDTIAAATGHYLGLVGGDYWHFGGTGAPITTFNAAAIKHWQQGGIVTLNFSMPNPTTGGPLYDLSGLDAGGLLTPGTSSYQNLVAALDGINAGLAELEAAGVVVLVRPFHELNGNWFWWGTAFLSTEQFQALWIFTHDYLTQTKGRKNLLWLYSVNAGTGSLTDRFPGAAYADLSGQDIYTSSPSQGQQTYQSLISLGLPTAISEFGSGSPQAGDTSFVETTLIDAIKSQMPRSIFWQQWWDGNTAAGWGMAEVQSVKAALSDPYVLNRGDLDFFKTTPPPPVVTPTPTPTGVLTPTSGGSVTDAAGRAWTLTAGGGVLLNGAVVAGGGGTDALTAVAGVIYGQDAVSSMWWANVGGTWTGPLATLPGPPVPVPPPVVVPPTPPPPPPPTITHATLQAQIDQATALLATVRAGLAGLRP